MSTDPTPADLERAREWEGAACSGCGATQGGRFACAECSASLAALLRSVREEGARQERAKLIGAVESHLKWLRAQDAPAPVVRKVEMISGLLENTPDIPPGSFRNAEGSALPIHARRALLRREVRTPRVQADARAPRRLLRPARPRPCDGILRRAGGRGAFRGGGMSEESSDWKARKEAMYAAAKRATTTAELADLVDRLRSEEHDYNSIVHACAAAALAACRVVDRGPHGGITGFQAGAIFWEFWSEWLASEEERTLGARILTWSNALYPQYRGTFAAPTIPTDTWQAMQSRALELLSKHADDDFVSANVRAHWRRIADGKPPFGLRVERTP